MNKNIKTILLSLLCTLTSCGSGFQSDSDISPAGNFNLTSNDNSSTPTTPTTPTTPSTDNTSQPNLTTYKVTFMDGKEQLDEVTVTKGGTVIYKGNQPSRKETKIDNITYQYTFVGWSEDSTASPTSSNVFSSNKLPAVTKDTVYFAIFKEEPAVPSNTYLVRIYQFENELINSFYVEKNNKASYSQVTSVDPKRVVYKGFKVFTFEFKFKCITSGQYYNQSFSYTNFPVVDYNIDFLCVYREEIRTDLYLEFKDLDDRTVFSISGVKYGVTNPKQDSNYVEPIYVDNEGNQRNFLGWARNKESTTYYNGLDIYNVITEEEANKAVSFYPVYGNNKTPVFCYLRIRSSGNDSPKYVVKTVEQAKNEGIITLSSNTITAYDESKIVTNFSSSNHLIKLFFNDSSIKKIGSNGLKGSNASYIYMPYVTEIGENGLQECAKLELLNAPKLETLKPYSLSKSNLSSSIIAPELKTISSNAFSNTQLNSFDLTQFPKLQTIEENAFSTCTRLVSINFSSTFPVSGLGITDSENTLFGNSPIGNITISGNNPQLFVSNNCLYTPYNGSTLDNNNDYLILGCRSTFVNNKKVIINNGNNKTIIVKPTAFYPDPFAEIEIATKNIRFSPKTFYIRSVHIGDGNYVAPTIKFAGTYDELKTICGGTDDSVKAICYCRTGSSEAKFNLVCSDQTKELYAPAQ